MSDPERSRRTGRTLLALGVALALILAGGRVLASSLAEILWFRSVGYSDVFWKFLWLRAATVLVIGAVCGLLVYVNLRSVAASLGRLRIRRRFGNLEFVEQIPRRYVAWITLGIAALLGLWFGLSAPGATGLQTLVYLNAGSWGTVEPILGNDLSFYVFLLPLLESMTAFGLVLLFMLLFMVAIGYATTGAVSWNRGRLMMDPGALRHLTTVLAAFLAVLAVQLWLSRYGLLVDGSSRVGQGIFGYVDANARLPGLAGLAAGCLVAAGVTVWAGRKGKVTPVLGTLIVLVVGGIALVEVFPSLIQRFEVDPNELERERSYIEDNLEATRLGFGLDRMTREDVAYSRAAPLEWEAAWAQLAGVPTWTQDALLATFQSLEARFRYYRFSSVTVDRYPGPEGHVPVAVSVRELDPQGIENPNWQNLHLRERFMRGAGAVANAATAATPEGRPEMLLTSLPPEAVERPGAPGGLALSRPEVYFATTDQPYAIVTPTATQFLAPDGSPGRIEVDFPRGIPLGSGFLRLLLAWGFQSTNLFFSSEIGEDSQFIIHRRVDERVRKIAPFLTYLEGPQAVIHEGRVVWILDGFTSSAHYPLSRRFNVAFRQVANYLRGSVKVTVDAVTGEMRFFVVDDEDPVLRAYARTFPGVFLPLSDMDPSLRAHLRYPRSLLTLQAQVLQTYHLETAAEFHRQEDVWTAPQELARGTTPVEYRPEYASFRLPGSDEPEFLLSTVFVPTGRPNLTAAFIARNDPGRYGELLLYEFQIEDGVAGPGQVEALIEQDPGISEQFSLWRQSGSQVWTGHLQLVPVGERVLYMEPVFLAAEESAMPELTRYVVSDGTRVRMDLTLAGALGALTGERGTPPEASQLPDLDPATTSSEALELLDRAETALREGDWAGFGAALEELRQVLERLSAERPGEVP